MKKQWVKAICFAAIAGWFFVSSALADELIGQLTDPSNGSIPGYVDILSARVEKSGSQLTCYMTTREPIPTSVSDPCNITYIWFIDADNNPQTGQNPGSAASEFNVRAVVTQTLDGWVDITGAWPPGGGQGAVTIDGAELTMTIDMSQIGSPDLFHFRCDAAEWNGTSLEYNGITPESAETWVSQYAVLYDEYQRYYGIDQNSVILRCDIGDPFNPDTATEAEHETWTSEGGQFEPQFNTIMAYDGSEYFIQSLGSSDFLQLRANTYFNLADAVTGTFGQSECQTLSGVTFSLLSRDAQTGPIPQGLFVLNIHYDYHLRASTDTNNAQAGTFAQIVITDVTDPTPVQKALWLSGRNVYMDKLSSVKTDAIDLAEKGLEFDRIYVLDLFLFDSANLYEPALTAQAATTSSLTASIDTLLTGDLDKNRLVDLNDFAALAENWLQEK